MAQIADMTSLEARLTTLGFQMKHLRQILQRVHKLGVSPEESVFVFWQDELNDFTADIKQASTQLSSFSQRCQDATSKEKSLEQKEAEMMKEQELLEQKAAKMTKREELLEQKAAEMMKKQELLE